MAAEKFEVEKLQPVLPERGRHAVTGMPDGSWVIEEPQPVLLERGRHAVTGMPDGSWVITRAGPLCERCENCGCGEQADPIPVPAMVVQVITGQANGGGMLQRVLGMVKRNGAA